MSNFQYFIFSEKICEITQWLEQGAAALEPHYENNLQNETSINNNTLAPLIIPKPSRALPKIPDSEVPKVPLSLPTCAPTAPDTPARGASPTNLIILNTPPSPSSKKIPQLSSDTLNGDLLTIPIRKTPISDPVSPNPPWHVELDRRHSDSAGHGLLENSELQHTYQNTELNSGSIQCRR